MNSDNQNKIRLDKFLTERGYVESRTKASGLIEAGKVKVNGVVKTKISHFVKEGDDINIEGGASVWVSRGAIKILKAFEEWNINVTRKTCIDIGASTGGFTQVLLDKGASKVFAVDVGHDQLHKKLRDDTRVINIEGVNIRDITLDDFTEFDDTISFACADVSFISLRHVLPKIWSFLSEGGEAVVLVKPQFELSRERLKKGIVKYEEDRLEALEKVRLVAIELGFYADEWIHSPIEGGDGNKEFLLHLKK